MHPIVAEVASRAWLFAAQRMNEFEEKDRADDELPIADKRLREFIIRFQAGSLFLDLFQGNEIRDLVDTVFSTVEIQTFVFDLYWASMVGIDRTDANYVMKSIAYTLTPNFIKPDIDGFRLPPNHDLLEAIKGLEFEDHKWKLSEEIIYATLCYLPWLVPLLLISTGELAGALDGSDLNTDQPR